MASGSLSFSPLLRNSLRIWLASTLAIGIFFWSGRSHVLPLALVMAVLFVNENDLTPARSIGQQVAGALIGILIAIVLHELSTSWPMMGIALLLTGVLMRSLGLLKGVSTGYLCCWAVELMHSGNQVNWAEIFDLAFAAVVGILMAQMATWALWPHRPLQQLPALEARIASQLGAQITAMQQWLSSGGTPPASPALPGSAAQHPAVATAARPKPGSRHARPHQAAAVALGADRQPLAACVASVAAAGAPATAAGHLTADRET